MRIVRIFYPVHTLGPGERMGIWTAGCPRHCPGCISPEMRSQDSGREFSEPEVLKMIGLLPKPPDGFTVSGGEPFLQPAELADLLEALSGISDDIIVFTGYTYEELKAMDDPAVDRALVHCGLLVDGPYIRERDDGIGMRGSSNQRFLVFKHAQRYADAEQWPRGVQFARYAQSVLSIGIP